MTAARFKKSPYVITGLGSFSTVGGGFLLRLPESQPWLGYLLVLAGLLELVLGVAMVTVELVGRISEIRQHARRERRTDWERGQLLPRVPDDQVVELLKQRYEPPPRRRPPDELDRRRESG